MAAKRQVEMILTIDHDLQDPTTYLYNAAIAHERSTNDYMNNYFLLLLQS